MSIVSSDYRNISKMVEAQLAVFPAHERFLAARFATANGDELKFLDTIAELIIRIAQPSLKTICEDYYWMTQVFYEEEIYFRRTGNYRLSKFADAVAQIYDNIPYMRRYMNGLLATQLWWRNHSDLLRVFRDIFLAGNAPSFSHLEIGPGHGLFLYLAAGAPGCASAEGWDISPASVEATRSALERMGAPETITLRLSDLFAAHARTFNSVVCSEVLEHLEEPAAALRALRGLVGPRGRIFINAPVNSPAPDHIYLFRSPEEVIGMIESAEFHVLHTYLAPATGTTLERARKQKLTISCAVIATPEGSQ